FLFRGDEVEKQVKVLSGGERNRLALAKLMLQPLNVLVMDEPTNHLDIQSKNVLKEALNNFEGTLILVSHDRDFLQGLTSVVYEFKDHKIKEYLGDIDYYLESRALENMREVEKKKTSTPKTKSNTSEAKLSYEQQKKQKALKNKIGKIEKKINQLEEKIKEKDLALAEDYEKTSAQPDFFKHYKKDKEKLEKKKTSTTKTKKNTSEDKLSYEQQKKQKALKNKIGKIEKKINQLEEKIKEKDLALAEDYEKTSAQPDFFKHYKKDKEKLE